MKDTKLEESANVCEVRVRVRNDFVKLEGWSKVNRMKCKES